MSKFEIIVEILKEIRSKTDEGGNYLYKDYALKAVGFSLGGALSQLLLFAIAGSDILDDIPLPLRAVTFAAPPPGNEKFLRVFKYMEMRGYLRHIRITNHGDIIPCFLPQTGVSIHLYPDKKAKVKYSDKVNWKNRTARAVAMMDPYENHELHLYRERLLMDFNSDLLNKEIEDFYRETGALRRLRRRSAAHSMFKKVNSSNPLTFFFMRSKANEKEKTS